MHKKMEESNRMTSPEKNYSQYKENTINASKPEELTLMLYNGLIKFIMRAQEEITARNLEAAHNTLVRCQDIIFEFQFTLNMEIEVSKNLMRLYDYMYNRLIEANAKKDTQILDEVLTFATDMRDTWIEVIKQAKEQLEAGAAESTEDAAAEAVMTEGSLSVPEPGNEAPKSSSTKAIYSKNARPVGAQAAGTVAAGVTPKPLTPLSALPVSTINAAVPAGGTHDAAAEGITGIPSAPAMQQAGGNVISFGGNVASKVFTNPLNKINPSVAAQYAKVSKSKNMPQENISISSK